VTVVALAKSRSGLPAFLLHRRPPAGSVHN
jgi:hypothetical protein